MLRLYFLIQLAGSGIYLLYLYLNFYISLSIFSMKISLKDEFSLKLRADLRSRLKSFLIKQ